MSAGKSIDAGDNAGHAGHREDLEYYGTGTEM
jgi:hypothetical protein